MRPHRAAKRMPAHSTSRPRRRRTTTGASRRADTVNDGILPLTSNYLGAKFSAAFWLLGMHWLLLSALPRMQSHAHTLRFFAFALIVVAALDKNRDGARKHD